MLTLEKIEKRTPIRLRGILIPLRSDLLESLEVERETNSIIEVKRVPHLLVGPLSKVNHDCHPNAEFTLQPKIHGQVQRIEATAK